MSPSAPHHPPPDVPPVPGMPDPAAPERAIEELLAQAGATEAPVALDLSQPPDQSLRPAAPSRAPGREPPRGYPPAPPTTETEGSFVEERSFMHFTKQPTGGRHLASRRVKGRPHWMLAPGGLALASLVLFIVALLGNLSPDQLGVGGSDDDDSAPDTRPAQAAPAVQEGQAPPPSPAEAEPAEAAPAPEPAAAKLTALAKVEGDKLGDIATYADGVMACVFRTAHTDAGQGLAQVSIKVKLKNVGTEAIDASTARVELSFAQQSSRATLVEERKGLGTVQPGGGEAIGEWIFRMPADQIDDISLTIAPSDTHEPVTFHGASR